MSQSSVSLWTLTQLQLLARACHRILKLTRTMPEPYQAQGDLAGNDEIR